MSFKDDLVKLYVENSDDYKAFTKLIEDLKSEMTSATSKGYSCILIDDSHPLSPILSYKNLLKEWCDNEGLQYRGFADEIKFIDIKIYWSL